MSHVVVLFHVVTVHWIHIYWFLPLSQFLVFEMFMSVTSWCRMLFTGCSWFKAPGLWLHTPALYQETPGTLLIIILHKMKNELSQRGWVEQKTNVPLHFRRVPTPIYSKTYSRSKITIIGSSILISALFCGSSLFILSLTMSASSKLSCHSAGSRSHLCITVWLPSDWFMTLNCDDLWCRAELKGGTDLSLT